MKNIFKFAAALAISAALGLGPTAYAFTIGQTGPDVAELQARLIESGHDIPAITSGKASFGYFGYQTQAALAASEGAIKPLKFGAAPGTDFNSPITIGSVPFIGNKTFMRNATNTPCSFIVMATTSLNAFLFQVSSSTAQATIWDLATSTVPNATTSLITQFTTNTTNLSAGKQGSYEWSNDQTQIGNISPNTYVTLGVRGVTGGSPGGSCEMFGIQY